MTEVFFFFSGLSDGIGGDIAPVSKAVFDDATEVLEFDVELNENRKSELNETLGYKA